MFKGLRKWRGGLQKSVARSKVGASSQKRKVRLKHSQRAFHFPLFPPHQKWLSPAPIFFLILVIPFFPAHGAPNGFVPSAAKRDISLGNTASPIGLRQLQGVPVALSRSLKTESSGRREKPIRLAQSPFGEDFETPPGWRKARRYRSRPSGTVPSPYGYGGWANPSRRGERYQRVYPGGGILLLPGQAGNLEQAPPKPVTYRTMCVRLCDGYYWPMSFATTKNRLKHDLRRCQSSCEAPVKLFYYPNPGGDIEQMRDLKGRRYVKLANAFRYRKELVQGCRCKPEPWSKEALAEYKKREEQARKAKSRRLATYRKTRWKKRHRVRRVRKRR